MSRTLRALRAVGFVAGAAYLAAVFAVPAATGPLTARWFLVLTGMAACVLLPPAATLGIDVGQRVLSWFAIAILSLQLVTLIGLAVLAAQPLAHVLFVLMSAVLGAVLLVARVIAVPTSGEE